MQKTGIAKVYNIVERAGIRGVKTPVVKARAEKMGVGDSERDLRRLQEEGMIVGETLEDSRMKVWYVCK